LGDIWTSKISNKTGFKGKELFMPLRLVLTGKSHGPELKYLIPLFDKNRILQKLGKI
jgi:Glutamyl- and glutaminyl-tRNA synthetases